MVDFIEFGWPIESKVNLSGERLPRNQAGARANRNKLKEYIVDELSRGTIVGPFKSNPLGVDAHFSPLDVIPKRDSDDIRVIMNLSYPHDDTAVNAGLCKDQYLGKSVLLKYPSVEDLVSIIKKKGRGCLLFKCDLWKCYHQIVMDPGSIHLLGFVVEGELFFDVVLSMGLRIACFICQRITNALIYLFRRLSYEGINYLDDLGAAELCNRAWEAFLALGSLLSRLGIAEAEGKASEPSEIMTFLSVSCNSWLFTLEITQDRLREILDLVHFWLHKSEASLQEVQSLAGKLNFVCSTVRAGRVFVSRILGFLRLFQGKPGVRKVSEDLKADLRWWSKFLLQFNGVTMFPELRWVAPDRLFSTDSCLSGCGGWSEGEFFHTVFPPFVLKQMSL